MLTVTLRNVMADAGAGEITELSLHDGNPGDTGDNELTGGSYARQSVTWGAATNGAAVAAGEPVFEVPGGSTVSHVGAWDSANAFMAYGLVTSETFGADGEYTLVSVTLSVANP